MNKPRVFILDSTTSRLSELARRLEQAFDVTPVPGWRRFAQLADKPPGVMADLLLAHWTNLPRGPADAPATAQTRVVFYSGGFPAFSKPLLPDQYEIQRPLDTSIGQLSEDEVLQLRDWVIRVGPIPAFLRARPYRPGLEAVRLAAITGGDWKSLVVELDGSVDAAALSKLLADVQADVEGEAPAPIKALLEYWRGLVLNANNLPAQVSAIDILDCLREARAQE